MKLYLFVFFSLWKPNFRGFKNINMLLNWVKLFFYDKVHVVSKSFSYLYDYLQISYNFFIKNRLFIYVVVTRTVRNTREREEADWLLGIGGPPLRVRHQFAVFRVSKTEGNRFLSLSFSLFLSPSLFLSLHLCLGMFLVKNLVVLLFG